MFRIFNHPKPDKLRAQKWRDTGAASYGLNFITVHSETKTDTGLRGMVVPQSKAALSAEPDLLTPTKTNHVPKTPKREPAGEASE